MTTPDAGQRLIEDLRECAADLSAQHGDDPETTLAWKAAHEIERLRGVEERMKLALIEARNTFRSYAQRHMDKGTVDGAEKAIYNHAMAETMDAAIAASRSTGAADAGEDHG